MQIDMDTNVEVEISEDEIAVMQARRERARANLRREENPRVHALLKNLVEVERIRPCQAIYLGCGEGESALYLAKNGFEVVGVDSSADAIRVAKKNYLNNLNYVQADVTTLNNPLQRLRAGIRGNFGFVLDWNLLEHISQQHIAQYFDTVTKLTEKGGHYLTAFTDNRKNYDAIILEKPLRSKNAIPQKDELPRQDYAGVVKAMSTNFDIIDEGEISALDIRQRGCWILARKK